MGSLDDPGAPGGISPRKGYTRAPFDDWRKPATGEDEDGGGWRSAGAGPSSRRWNAAGWRNEEASYNRTSRYGERDYVNGSGGPGNSRWKEPEGSYRGARGGRGGHHNNFSSGRSRMRHQNSDDLPEWACEEPANDHGGSFDSAGKFQVPGRSNGSRHITEGDDEDIGEAIRKAKPEGRTSEDWDEEDQVVIEEEVTEFIV